MAYKARGLTYFTMATFATAFPTTAPTTPNASTSLKRRMSPHAPIWPECNATMMTHQQIIQQPQQPSFKRARLSHNSPGELCLQRDLKSLSHSHQWQYDSHNACWVYEQDPNIRLHKMTCNFGAAATESQLQLLLEFSQDAHIKIEIPRMYPHQTPVVTKIQGLWMDSILIRQQQQQHAIQSLSHVSSKTVVFDQWSPVIHLSTLLEFCIHHAKMHPTLAHARLPTAYGTLGERTNTLHHHPRGMNHHTKQVVGDSENSMDVSHPYKYTSPFAPNRMDVGYNKQELSYQHHHHQQATSQDAMEM